ncbi:MAG: GDP-mannose 4,6-dehydratase [Elusimicrobia bacterium]|nr:GDP-mannose 4,6-dehydratase [Elusimicrobiota bacterium]
MKYFLTGGAGFVGSHLSEHLLSLGHSVTVLDDLSTGAISNITHLKGRRDFQYVIDTVANKALLAEMVDAADIVFHLAAAVGVKLIVESPVRTIETNVKLTELVLEVANKKNRPVFVASTSEVYGKSAAIPFREDGDLVMGATSKGRWSYACSKALDEFLAIAYWKERGLPVVVARLFNTVGPRQTGRYGMVVPTLVRQALAGEPMTVYGDGTQRRCFTHVKDSVRAQAALMQCPAAVGQVFNIGSQNEISIMGLAERIKELAGSSSPIKLVPYSEAYEEGFEDMARRVPDLTRVHAAIGYEPKYTLDDIIRDVISYERGLSAAQPAAEASRA